MYLEKFVKNLFYTSQSKIEAQCKIDINNIIKKKPENVEQHNFKNFGWGYVVFTNSNISMGGNNYAEPFYIITESKRFIKNGKDVSGKISGQFIEENYNLLKNQFNKIGIKQK
ncbi:MAG TPA: hypothetical protein PKJ33_00985 [Alphaproteobacteria bacterium]|nr:hypothetical protein [Alphaproteobacteria bacterium]